MKSSHGLVMDGFMRDSSGSAPSQPKIHKITEASNLLIPKSASDRLRTAAKDVHSRAQRSQTLMRSAVKKPTATIAKTANYNLRRPEIKPRIAAIDSGRLNRVQTIEKNQKVRHFGHGVSAIPKQPAQTQQAKEQKAEVGEVVPRQERAKTASPNAKSLVYKPLPSMITSASHQQLERLLDEALTRADAHKKHKRGQMPEQSLLQKALAAPRWLSVGVAVVIVGLLAGFIAMNKIPAVAVRIAAAKAHIAAQVPGYTPSGFSFAGPVSYSDGKVGIQYKANDSSSRAFTISQASSKMSSKSLEDKVVPDNVQVQTSVVNGTTVYIYGQSNDAAWVNNGMQYTIKDGANLNSDQLLKIANSFN
jgi:hypothetical protein